MRAQGGGGGRARGREERKEVRWAWMGRKGLGMRRIGLKLGSEVLAAAVVFLNHGNWNWKGMATVV
uniref:Uncharacterized protein n=1 Tax=Arundo donax TaxID=35708 RepID=A0A0A9F3H8_ARUDO